MSADRLREAAKVLRERAGSASEGPWWDIRAGLPGTDAEWIVDSDSTFICSTQIDGERGKGDAAYIATMHPGVGLALADWLDAVGADEWAHGPSCLTPCDECDDDPYAPHARRALVIADLILGEQS